jgi:hypothetical protein
MGLDNTVTFSLSRKDGKDEMYRSEMNAMHELFEAWLKAEIAQRAEWFNSMSREYTLQIEVKP